MEAKAQKNGGPLSHILKVSLEFTFEELLAAMVK